MKLRHAMVIMSIVWRSIFAAESDVDGMAKRVYATDNNTGKIFAIIDKVTAKLNLYDSSGNLMATSSVLVGQTLGDASVPGIGDRRIQDIAEHERTTPAGRFQSQPGMNLSGETVVWIDYEAAVSMHKLRPSKSGDKRPERMASDTPLDNRITYGCVNVPVDFYEKWIQPTLGKEAGIIYILPETQSAMNVFLFLR